MPTPVPHDEIGIVSAARAKAELHAARNPAQADRILGRKTYRPPTKLHRITVNIANGARIVESDIVVEVALPSPPTAAANPFATNGRSDRQTKPEPYRPERIPLFRPPLKLVLEAVAQVYDVRVSALLSPCRQWRLAHVRFACYRMLASRDWSQSKIGRAFDRDHSTVLHGLRRAADLHENNPRWRSRYERALRLL